jgi:hypothetical protein
VSTRLATAVQILSLPVTFRGWLAKGLHFNLALKLTSGRFVEEAEPLLYAEARDSSSSRWHNADHVASRLKVDVVSRLDVVLFGNRLRDRDLELGSNL